MKKSFASIFFVSIIYAAVCSAAFAQKVTIDIAGYGAEAATIVPVSVEWNDAWFEPFAEPKYNHKLARAAGVLSYLSYDKAEKDKKKHSCPSLRKIRRPL